MKKVLWVAALWALPSMAEACDGPARGWVADLGLHVIAGGYQQRLGCHAVLQGSVGLYVPWTVNDNVLGLGVEGRSGDIAGAMLRVRAFWYPFGEAPSGLWVSPFAQVGVVQGSRAITRYGSAAALGVAAGYTFRLGARWLLAAGAGPQFHRASVGGSTESPGFSRLGLHVDLNVVYRF